MPVLELSDEELQGFIMLAATASGPGVNWMLTNALLTKARLAQEQSQQSAQNEQRPLNAKPTGLFLGNSEDHDAAVPRA